MTRVTPLIGCLLFMLGRQSPADPGLPLVIAVDNNTSDVEVDVSVWDFKAARYVYATTFPPGARSCGVLEDPSNPASYARADTMLVEIVTRRPDTLTQMIALGPFPPMRAQAWRVVLSGSTTATTASLTPLDRWPC